MVLPAGADYGQTAIKPESIAWPVEGVIGRVSRELPSPNVAGLVTVDAKLGDRRSEEFLVL